jgi:sulfatase maturation enzyme AslB (radical SAM superfamily)
LELGVTTNGLALNSPAVREQAIHCFRQITVSVDGLAEYHDILRQTSGLHRRLRRTVQELNAVRDPQRMLLRVNTVLTAGNISSFPEFCQEMADWGFDELTFNQLGGNDRPEFFPENRLRPEQIACFRNSLAEVRRVAADQGLQVRGSPAYLNRLVASAHGLCIPVADCDPGERFLFVDENGVGSPCSFTGSELGWPVNSLLHRGREGLIAFFRESRSRCRPSACQDCHATHVFEKFG